jgi:murein DD-endopeptidase MepM/ murein hydrolase activator NlpD
VKTHDTEYPVDFVEIIAYTAAKTGGKFDTKALKILNNAAGEIAGGESDMEDLTEDMKYYPYYREAYGAVLENMVGEFEEEYVGEDGENHFRRVYGLKAYFPLAKGFDYTHYDDFGAGRSYGYKRKHLGHDMMGQIGTPIISVESGYVEALGWNQYGGWRIGIRSLDGKRYYYYAHLRQNYPYAEGLAEGDLVTAGDVIGYMGHTGYSIKENVNNIEVTHLHWGLELIFDESQKESDNEIWIDLYALTGFLAKHTQQVRKVGDTREWERTLRIKDPLLEAFEKVG